MYHLNTETTKCSFDTAKHKLSGVLYIFNHKNFDKKLKHGQRIGTEHDVAALQDAFAEFDVINILYNDLTVSKLRRKVTEISKEDYSRNSSIIIAILSHGCDNHMLAANDGHYDFYEIARTILSNRTLKLIPKIFLIQACRGDINLFYLRNAVSDGTSEQQPQNYYCKDLYILHSTTEITNAFRLESDGSFFIQTFCKLLKKHGYHRTIREIFDMVMEKVQELTNSCHLPQISINTNNRYIFGNYHKPDMRTLQEMQNEFRGALAESWIDSFVD